MPASRASNITWLAANGDGATANLNRIEIRALGPLAGAARKRPRLESKRVAAVVEAQKAGTHIGGGEGGERKEIRATLAPMGPGGRQQVSASRSSGKVSNVSQVRRLSNILEIIKNRRPKNRSIENKKLELTNRMERALAYGPGCQSIGSRAWPQQYELQQEQQQQQQQRDQQLQQEQHEQQRQQHNQLQQVQPAQASPRVQQRPATASDQMELVKSVSRVYQWNWNQDDQPPECLVSNDQLQVCFHPYCSDSAAAIRGSRPLVRNGNYYYWEVTAFDKVYGTSVMFGVCTKKQLLRKENYVNLIGLDQHGWSLSHKGHIWHNGKNTQYTNVFPTDQSVTIGLLFDTMRGELSYFMDGKNLGVAFAGLNDVEDELYPVVGSTAKCTRMRLTGSYCGYMSLLERSCFALLKTVPDRSELVKKLHRERVPLHLIRYLAETTQICAE